MGGKESVTHHCTHVNIHTHARSVLPSVAPMSGDSSPQWESLMSSYLMRVWEETAYSTHIVYTQTNTPQLFGQRTQKLTGIHLKTAQCCLYTTTGGLKII